MASVPMAKFYYDVFKKQMSAEPTKNLRVAIIYSYGANEAEADGILDEENSDIEKLKAFFEKYFGIGGLTF